MVTVYARITVNGKRPELSLGRRVEEKRLDSQSGRLRGKSMEVFQFKCFLDTVKNRCYEIYDVLLKEHQDISASIIKNIYLGKEGKEWMVLEIFQDHNNEMVSLIGKGFTKVTLQCYNAAKKHV